MYLRYMYIWYICVQKTIWISLYFGKPSWRVQTCFLSLVFYQHAKRQCFHGCKLWRCGCNLYFFWDPINSGLCTQLLSHWKWGILQKCKFLFLPWEMIINLGISGGFPRNSQRPISSHGRPPWSSQLELSQAQPLTGPRRWRVFTSYPLHEAVKQNNPHMVAPLRRIQYQLHQLILLQAIQPIKKAFIQHHPTTPRQNFKLMKVCRSVCGLGISENAANLTPDVGFGYCETMLFFFCVVFSRVWFASLMVLLSPPFHIGGCGRIKHLRNCPTALKFWGGLSLLTWYHLFMTNSSPWKITIFNR